MGFLNARSILRADIVRVGVHNIIRRVCFAHTITRLTRGNTTPLSPGILQSQGEIMLALLHRFLNVQPLNDTPCNRQ